VVKTYGTTQMKRAVCDVEDIRQQLMEWDDRFGITDQSKRGLKNLLRNNRPRARETTGTTIPFMTAKAISSWRDSVRISQNILAARQRRSVISQIPKEDI
jgi:hypothetical protein